MTIGERIKELRISKGISQIDLAEKTGSSKQTIYKYENGIVTNIPSDKLESIANILGCTPAYLMGWNEKKTVPVFEPEHIELIDLYSRLEPEQKQTVMSLLRSLVKK